MAILTIGGTAVVDPSTLTVDREDILSSGSGVTQSGKEIRDVIATKTILNVSWAALTWAQASTLLTAIEASVFFTVTYPDPKSGTYLTKTFSVDTRTVPALRLISGEEIWNGISFKLKEQ